MFKPASSFVKQKTKKQYEQVFDLPLGPESRESLDSYFTQFPPTPEEMQRISTGGKDLALDDSYGAPSTTAGGKKKNKNKKSSKKDKNDEQDTQDNEEDGASKKKRKAKYSSQFSPDQVAKRHQKWLEKTAQPSMSDLITTRHNLPIASYKVEIIAALVSSQVILIAGETGCGKTTQVPQYILEDAWSRNEPCRVVCTQPRRISAISVAERIANERGENVGDNVGYSIRLESRGGPETSLMFCTNGVLLRMLTDVDGDYRSVDAATHLVCFVVYLFSIIVWNTVVCVFYILIYRYSFALLTKNSKFKI